MHHSVIFSTTCVNRCVCVSRCESTGELEWRPRASAMPCGAGRITRNLVSPHRGRGQGSSRECDSTASRRSHKTNIGGSLADRCKRFYVREFFDGAAALLVDLFFSIAAALVDAVSDEFPIAGPVQIWSNKVRPARYNFEC